MKAAAFERIQAKNKRDSDMLPMSTSLISMICKEELAD